MNVNLFFVNIIMCNSFVLYNQDDHQIVCKINIFIVIVDIISVLTTFFGSDREGYPRSPHSDEGLIPRANIFYIGIDP